MKMAAWGQTYSESSTLLILDIYGCKDTLACNYDEYVTQDNGTNHIS